MFTVVQCVRSQGGWAVSNHQIHIIDIWLHSYLCKPSGAFLNVCNKVCGLLFKIEFKVVNQSVWWCASGSRASLVQNPQKLIKAWCWAFLCVCSCFGPLIWWCFQFYSKYSTAHALPSHVILAVFGTAFAKWLLFRHETAFAIKCIWGMNNDC